MQYQKTTYNFIPKENSKTQFEENSDNINIKEEIPKVEVVVDSSLKEENAKLIKQIGNLKKKLEETESLLIKKNNEIDTIITEYNEYLQYEKSPNEFKELKAVKIEADSIKNQISVLNEENESLKNQVESYKTHIQYLYLILLILAII